MQPYEQIMRKYGDQISVQIAPPINPAHIEFPLQLLIELWKRGELSGYLTAGEPHPILEEHGLPRGLDLSTILQEVILPGKIGKVHEIRNLEITDGQVSIDCLFS